MEEFSKEAEDVGRGVNHHWGLSGIDVKFGGGTRELETKSGEKQPRAVCR